MVQIKHNGPQFKAALMRGVKAGKIARKDALLIVTKAIGSHVQRIAPVDTGRFKKGEAQAFNGVLGGPVFSAARVVNTRSKYADLIRRQLEKQVAYWRGAKQWLETHDRAFKKGRGGRGRGQPTKGYKQASRMLERAEGYLAEWIASGESGAVIGLKEYQRWKEAQRRKDKDMANVLTRAYNTDKHGQDFGGYGKLIEGAGQTVAVIVNREPHAKIVEYNKRVRSEAIFQSGMGMVRKASQSYVRKIGAATGLSA